MNRAALPVAAELVITGMSLLRNIAAILSSAVRMFCFAEDASTNKPSISTAF
jgi:hypothetical protein